VHGLTTPSKRAMIAMRGRERLEAEARQRLEVGGKEFHRGRRKGMVNPPEPFSKELLEKFPKSRQSCSTRYTPVKG
jgi:hypothetical protein